MWRHVKGTRAAWSVGLPVLAVMVVTGCGSAEQNGGPGSGTTVPTSLLDEDVVGATAIGDGGSRATSAGPDGAELLGGATDKNTMAYEHGSGRARQLVLVGAWKRTASSVRSGLAELDACLEEERCDTEPVTFSAHPLSLLTAPTTAFASTYVNQEGTRVSIKRSYTYLRPRPNFDGTLVMVSIQREGRDDPSTSELARLTEAQVAETKKMLRG